MRVADRRVEVLTELIVGDSKKALLELEGMLPLFGNLPPEKYGLMKDRVSLHLSHLVELIPLWIKLKN